VQMVVVNSLQVGSYLKKVIPKRLHELNIKCIAGNVANNICFKEMLGLDYDLFIGPFFQEPNVVAQNEITTSKTNLMQFINEINQPQIDFRKLEIIIKHDISISYKLLKLINSASLGLNNEVSSIRQALTLLGKNEIRKWFMLFVLGNMGSDKPVELLNLALTRAKFLELLAMATGFEEKKEDFYLIGLFSLLDVFLNKPLATILADLTVSKMIKKALLNEPGKASDIFNFVIQYEKSKWLETSNFINDFGLKTESVSEMYINATNSTRHILKTFER